jgi:predicted small metal-binding protein
MKKFKCPDCEVEFEFESETKEEVLVTLYNHYMQEHKEVITSADEVEKKRWMEQFEKDWDAADLV